MTGRLFVAVSEVKAVQRARAGFTAALEQVHLVGMVESAFRPHAENRMREQSLVQRLDSGPGRREEFLILLTAIPGGTIDARPEILRDGLQALDGLPEGEPDVLTDPGRIYIRRRPASFRRRDAVFLWIVLPQSLRR